MGARRGTQGKSNDLLCHQSGRRSINHVNIDACFVHVFFVEIVFEMDVRSYIQDWLDISPVFSSPHHPTQLNIYVNCSQVNGLANINGWIAVEAQRNVLMEPACLERPLAYKSCSTYY